MFSAFFSSSSSFFFFFFFFSVVFSAFLLAVILADFNMELQIAVCSTGPHRGNPNCSVQCRTSPGSPRADRAAPGPHPRSYRADRAAPDLTRGAPERTVHRRTSPRDLPSGPCSAGPQLPEDMSKGMSEDMSEDMSKDMSEDMSEKNVRKNASGYVRRNVNRNIR